MVTQLNIVSQMVKIRKIDVSDLILICVDEADYFFEDERTKEEMERLYKYIDEMRGPGTQKLFFSATYQQEILTFIKALVPSNSIKIELPKERLTLAGIKQMYYVAKSEKKDDKRFNPKLRAIIDIYNNFDGVQTMVFFNTKNYLTFVHRYLTEQGLTVDKFMGGKDMDYAERD